MSLEIENSPQYNDLTTSDNGRNVRAVLQALSHFFLEDNDFVQTSENSFGVTSETKFRTTSKVTFSGTKKVYAVCQGEVFVQPQTGDNNKVNIILRPYKQPINSISIKYFIYRGLNKSDFFVPHENNRLKITGNATTGTDFIKHIWGEFDRFYNEIDEEKPVFWEEFIGFPASAGSQSLTDLIDSYFYKIAQYDEETGEEIEGGTYELPLIPRGLQIGNATNEIGFDVVLNTGDYYIENDPNPFQLNLAFARAAEGILNTADGTSDFQKKLIRESCTWFIDPVAFYGIHANGHGKLYVGESITPLTSKEDIYAQIEGFHTKNTIYLYIQSNRQRSYNFYGNYVLSETNSNNIRTGTSEVSMTETVFGTLGWPVQNINLSSNSSQSLFIKLLAKYYSEGCFLYSKIGDIQNTLRNDFVLQREIFDENITTSTVDYTNSIEFKLNTLETTVNISTVFQVIFFGVETPVSYLSDETNIIKKENKKLLFELFESLQIRPIYNDNSDFKTITINNLSMVKVDFDKANSPSQTERIILNKVIFDKGYKEDLNTGETLVKDRVLYISQLSQMEDNFYYTTISKELTETSDEAIKMKSAYDNDKLILSYNNLDGQKSALLLNDSEDYFLNMFQLGLTLDEINQLTQILPGDAHNIRFCFDESLEIDDVDEETNVSFLKFDVGVVFENDMGILETLFPIQSIQVFGSRINFLASKSYIEYEKNSTTEINDLVP